MDGIKDQLGKIQKASFGRNHDGQLGLFLTLGGPGWGVNDSDTHWGHRSERAEWTHEEWLGDLGAIVLRLNDLLKKAKVCDVSELVGIPVRVKFKNRVLDSFEVLEEVL